VSQACPLFLVIPGASSTPLSPLFSARSRDRAPSSNHFRIAAYLDPQVGPRGTSGGATDMLFVVGDKIVEIEHSRVESKALVWQLGRNTNGEWL